MFLRYRSTLLASERSWITPPSRLNTPKFQLLAGSVSDRPEKFQSARSDSMTLRSFRGVFLLGAVLAAISCAEEPGTPSDPGPEPEPNLANSPPDARCKNV